MSKTGHFFPQRTNGTLTESAIPGIRFDDTLLNDSRSAAVATAAPGRRKLMLSRGDAGRGMRTCDSSTSICVVGKTSKVRVSLAQGPLKGSVPQVDTRRTRGAFCPGGELAGPTGPSQEPRCVGYLRMGSQCQAVVTSMTAVCNPDERTEQGARHLSLSWQLSLWQVFGATTPLRTAFAI